MTSVAAIGRRAATALRAGARRVRRKRPAAGDSRVAPFQRSLALRIGIIYLLFSVIALTAYSILVFQNQASLLNENFTNESRKLGDQFAQRAAEVPPGVAVAEAIQTAFDLGGLRRTCFQFFSADDVQSECIGDARMHGQLMDRLVRFRLQAETFQSPLLIEPDAADFSALMSGVARLADGSAVYYVSFLDGARVRQGIEDLYSQAITLLASGVALNAALAVLFHRILFRRLSELETVSRKLSTGELSARVAWSMQNRDELDSVGLAFNNMADRIQVTVKQLEAFQSSMAHELEVGRFVQGMMLTDVAVIKDFDPALEFRPMREVSGDVYCFFDHGNGCKTIFLGDATGHGVSAALITASLSVLLDRILQRTAAPGRVLQLLSKELALRFNSEFFVTAICVLAHPSGKLYYANAGHTAGLLLSKRRRSRALLKADSPMLGIPVEIDIGTFEIAFESGDKLMLYTDGLTEAMDANRRMFELDAAGRIFEQRFDRPNAEIMQGIMQAYDEFSCGATDDTTVLLLTAP